MDPEICEAVAALAVVLSRVPARERIEVLAWLAKLHIDRPDVVDHLGSLALGEVGRG
jgi:hypothetical protein